MNRRSQVLLTTLGFGLMLLLPGFATATSISFDDYQAPRIMSTEYETQGLYFAGERPAITSQNVPACNYESTATSTPNVLGPQPLPYSPMTLQFSADARSKVTTYVSFNLIGYAGNGISIDFTDSDGRVKTIHYANPYGSGRPPSSCTSGPYSLLQVVTMSAPQADGIKNIAKIQFRPDAVGSLPTAGYAIDDLVYTATALPSPPPVVTEFSLTGEATCVGTQPSNQLTWTEAAGATSYWVEREWEIFGTKDFMLIALLSSTQRSYSDALFATSTQTYRIRAVNAAGAVLSNTVLLRPRSDCSGPSVDPPPPPPSVTVTPTYVTLIPGQIQQFSVRVDNAGSTSPTVQWSVDEQTGSIASTGRFTASGNLGEYIGAIRARAIINGQPYIGTASVKIVSAVSRTIFGDIYARGNVGNLAVSADSVVSATGTVTITGSSYAIPSYPAMTSSETAETITRLIVEKASTLATGDYTLSGRFNLNPKQPGNPLSLEDNAANPEGGVWYVGGDLLLGDAVITGRGTIIVGGAVRVSGRSLTYADVAANSDDVLGIIVPSGDVNLLGLETVQAAIYAPKGTITLGANTIGKGLFAAKSVALESVDIGLSYDARIAKKPPPGFSESFVPALSEVSP